MAARPGPQHVGQKRGPAVLVFLLWVLVLGVASCRQSESLKEQVVEITDDGAWCWFQDPRSVYVEGEHRRTYAQWVSREGHLQVGSFDHESLEVVVQTLETDWGANDHNVGSFLVMPDKRLMVFSSRHNGTGVSVRMASRPEDIGAWEEPVTVSGLPRSTYSHAVYLSAEDRFFVFWRGPNWKPVVATSQDGRLWSGAMTLVEAEGREHAGVRPYLKIASDGVSSIHIAFTDGHPQVEPENSIYYVRYENGAFHGADGRLISNELPLRPEDCDRVYDGKATGVRAWIWDLAFDAEGRPVVALARFPGPGDHRYAYAHWSEEGWRSQEIVEAGGPAPEISVGEPDREPFYSGGMALDPADPSVVYLSRPVKGTFEIERWHTTDWGRTWASTSVTSGSTQSNLRPHVPRGDSLSRDQVLWMRGAYRHFTDFETEIVLYLGTERSGG